MSAKTQIEWTDSTFNFWEGCQKVGPGCDHCYAETRNARFAGGVAINWGPGAPRRLTSITNRNLPKRWNREHDKFFAEHGRRQRVFCSSLSDVFDNAVDPDWRHDLLALIGATQNLDWLLLTKRIGNVAKMVPPAWLLPGGWPAHVRIGATIVNQEEADRDIPKLLALPCPNFLSMEPLLGAVDLSRVMVANGILRNMVPATERLQWVIVGGETGPGARPMHPNWVTSLRDQCAAAGVPYLFKQWGDWKPICQMPEAEDRALWVSKVKAGPNEDQDVIDDCHGRRCTAPYIVVHIDGSTHAPLEPNAFIAGAMTTYRIGKGTAGRHLDGRTWDGFPA